MNSAHIQFTGPTCGHHGPYTFYKAFKYRRLDPVSKFDGDDWKTLSLGQFFYIRVLPCSSICVGELQLVWESSGGVPGQMMASVKLYFRPEDTPAGRQSTHGQDELVVIKDKFVIELTDLVKWVVEMNEIPIGWPSDQRQDNDGITLGETRQVCIISYPQYCRYRAMRKRIGREHSLSSSSLDLAIVKAVGGASAALALIDSSRQFQIMFCRSAVNHPAIENHQFRRDSLAPKLKGRKRRKLRIIEITEATASGLINEQKTNARLKKVVLPSPVESQTAAHVGKDLLKKGKDTFEKQLLKFMKENKTPIKRRPSLGFKEVDLFNFYSLAHKYGGYDKITEDRLWKHIYDQLGGHQGNTSAATCTRRIYEKLLLSFERHVRGQDNKSVPAPYLRPSKSVRRPRSSASTTVANSSESLGGSSSNGADNSASNSMDHESSNCSSSTTVANSIDDMLSSPSSMSKDSSTSKHRHIRTASGEKKELKRHHRVEKPFKVKRHKVDEDVENQSSWSAVTVSAEVNDNVVCKVILKNCRRSSLQTPTKDILDDEVATAMQEEVTNEVIAVKTELPDQSGVTEVSKGDTSNLPCSILSPVNDIVKVKQSVVQKVEMATDLASTLSNRTGKVELQTTNVLSTLHSVADGLRPEIPVEVNRDMKVTVSSGTESVQLAQKHQSLVGGLLVCTQSPLGIPMAPSLVNLSSVCSSTAVINSLVSRLIVGPSLPTSFQTRQPMPINSVTVTSTPMVNVEGSNWSYPLLNGGTWLALTSSRPPSISASIDMPHPVRVGVLPVFGLSTSSSMTPSSMAVKAERPCLTVGYRMPVISGFECRPQTTTTTSVVCSQPALPAAAAAATMGLGLNSPIKQFIDRTRVCAPTVVQPFPVVLDDGPTDMSMKTLRRQEQESRLNCITKLNQSNDAPLDLCTKITCATKAEVGNTLPLLTNSAPNLRQNIPLAPTHGPILTVPMCFATKSSASLPLPLSGTVAGASAAGAIGARIILPTPRLPCSNGASMSPLPGSLPRGPAVNLPIMQLPPYSQGQSNFAILHPAFQLSPNTGSPIGAGSVPLSPSTPVIATLSPFLGSQFLMTQLAAAAGLNDNQSSSELRK